MLTEGLKTNQFEVLSPHVEATNIVVAVALSTVSK
jgi:hypothetical protein